MNADTDDDDNDNSGANNAKNKLKVHQLWRGNNIFCCDGRILIGASPGICAVTALAFIVPYFVSLFAM